MHPIFQTWRKRLSSGSWTYDRTNEYTGPARALDGAVNVFMYPDLEWRVETGDVMGAYQPERTKSKTFLSFQEEFGPLIYFTKVSARPEFDVSRASQNRSTPLISIEATGV